jgi:N-acetylmuramoyl-L-alanine amidase
MRRATVRRLQRLFAIIGFGALVGIVVIGARIVGMGLPWEDELATQPLVVASFNRQVALISGHAGHDSGAVCTDAEGNVIVTEEAINAEVSELAAGLLREAGADVVILEEYDPHIDGLQADVLLSIHADSCIEASGYKAAFYVRSHIPETEQRLLDCIDQHYAAVTGLALHADTVTHNMTEYHAFRKIAAQTPAAILELGFMGGDQALLTQEPARVARGVADSLLCFLEVPEATPEPTQAPTP